MNKAYKFRIYPNSKQKDYFEKCFRSSDFIFNYFLREQNDINDVFNMYGLTKKEKAQCRKDNKTNFSKFEASRHLTQIKDKKIIKYKDTFISLSELESSMRTYALESLNQAFSRMRTTGSGYPNYKNRNSLKSYKSQINYYKIKPTNFKIYGNTSGKFMKVDIPCVKNISIALHRKDFLEKYNDKNRYKLNSCTVSRNNSGEYFISIQFVDNESIIPDKKEIKESTSIGIDRGVKRPITTSSKDDFDNEIYSTEFKSLKHNEAKLKELQRILALKRLKNSDWKKSNKYQRLKNKVSKLYNHITNQRNYQQHLITTELVNKEDNDTFILEKLNVKGMTKRSAKGKSNKKRHLSKAMLNVGFYNIATLLTYKANRLGKNIEYVSAAYTSQKCINCGHINKLNRASQSEFKCIKCDYNDNADFIGATNIKDKFFNKF